MASAFPLPVTAAQVGTYFVGQYYRLLQNQPDFVYQFYNDASTMLRIDGNSIETASAMLQIHHLAMSLNYTEIEIKTAHSLESWNSGVLVMVSGSVHVKGLNGRKKFVETFFLAPQEKGYFVLNDIFHYIDEEQIIQHPDAYFPQSNLDSRLNSSTELQEQATHYGLGEDFQSKEFVAPGKMEESGPANNYQFPDEQFHQVPETEQNMEDNFSAEVNGSLQGNISSIPDHLSPSIEEPAMEPLKHTYASILQVAKGQSAPVIPNPSSSNKPPSPSEWQNLSEPANQPLTVMSSQIDVSGMEYLEEISPVEDEVMSVYVSNVPTFMSASEIGEEFKKFGNLKPGGVAIRTRKDIDACYAFVEFEDTSGVQNAIKASTVQIGGYQLYIEERRPNRNNYTRGGRARGKGRVSYHMDGTRGRLGGRSFGRGLNQDVNDRNYNRPRGNGYCRQVPRQDRTYPAYQQGSRNGHNTSE